MERDGISFQDTSTGIQDARAERGQERNVPKVRDCVGEELIRLGLPGLAWTSPLKI